MESEAEHQFYNDGGNFECSIPYHIYVSEAYLMIQWLNWLGEIKLDQKLINKIKNIFIIQMIH